ncbi:MAG: hypothetical protein IJG06_08460 [Clostridia bacterium]|nr:hypothetical protein [Clostridia bacterium]
MEDIKKKLRKVQDTLVITGTGVCAFGIWGVISTVMYLIMNKNELADLIEKNDLQHFIPVFYAILFIAVAATYAVYLFVGLSARSEGLKKKSRYVYLFFAFLMLVCGVLIIITEIVSYDSSKRNLFSLLISVIITFTLLITLLQMIIASIQSKILRKRIKEREGE